MKKQRIHLFKDLNNLLKLKQLWDSGQYTKADLARKFDTSVPTILRALKKLEALK
tara:strand:- start:16434 stop:16598 length:165 start_codon:yes stop_codon:yes gene_type:complete